MAQNMQRRGSVRIGPISILVFVIALCTAVMAVLALVTANANTSYTERQIALTDDVYTNERTAQTFLSSVDDTLHTQGVTGLSGQLQKLADSASMGESVQVDATLSDAGVLDATFETSSGRQLIVQLTVTDTGYTITKWKTDIDWEEDTSVKLWQG